MTLNALTYLRNHNVLTLATYGPEGLWAAAVFYVNEGFTFYFLSSPNSRHSRNLTKCPDVVGTIQEDYKNWSEIKGIQFEGEAQQLEGVEQAEAIRHYGAKFPLVGNLDQATTEIVTAMSKITWYKIIPMHLYFIDNSLGFGHRDEMLL